MSLSLIVAVAQNGVIGRDNALPWHLPEDLRRFKSLTMGHHLIMGRRTFESLGRLLPGRTSVVVTRDLGFVVPGAVVVHSLPEALEAAREDPEPFLIGGASLFVEALPHVDKIYLTRVLQDCDGDTYLDLRFLTRGWRCVVQGDVQHSQESGLPFRYEEYERVES